MKEQLKKFVASNRNYNPYSLSRNIVEKTFNRGMGSLALLRFYEEEKTIVINKSLFSKSDERKLREFCRDCHIEDWVWKYDSLYYPDYYFRTLSIRHAS